MSDSSLQSLTAGVELLSLDAGNTVIFLDHARISSLLAAEGFVASRDDLVRMEGEAKRALEDGGGTRVHWQHDQAPGARSWGNMIGSIAALAGVPVPRVPEVLARFWPLHMERNFWWLVPEGLGPALEAVRAAGVPVVIVSNSEGMLDVLFEFLGIARHFDMVVDSGKVGIEKPDSRIWQIALDRYPTKPNAVLHLGDTFATDIAGAEPLGFRAGLIDPYGHYADRHARVQRVPGVVEVADAIVRGRAVRTASRADSSP